MLSTSCTWGPGATSRSNRVEFRGPQVFKTKDANDLDGLGYGLLVTAGQWSMCWSLCPYESVTPNACSWPIRRIRSLCPYKSVNNYSFCGGQVQNRSQVLLPATTVAHAGPTRISPKYNAPLCFWKWVLQTRILLYCPSFKLPRQWQPNGRFRLHYGFLGWNG